MRSTKQKISFIVRRYIADFPDEFAIVKRGIEAKRKMTRDEYATLEGSKDSRALFELPERLHERLALSLNEEELVWFKSKSGAHYFARHFPVFALPDSI